MRRVEHDKKEKDKERSFKCVDLPLVKKNGNC